MGVGQHCHRCLRPYDTVRYALPCEYIEYVGPRANPSVGYKAWVYTWWEGASSVCKAGALPAAAAEP